MLYMQQQEISTTIHGILLNKPIYFRSLFDHTNHSLESIFTSEALCTIVYPSDTIGSIRAKVPGLGQKYNFFSYALGRQLKDDDAIGAVLQEASSLGRTIYTLALLMPIRSIVEIQREKIKKMLEDIEALKTEDITALLQSPEIQQIRDFLNSSIPSQTATSASTTVTLPCAAPKVTHFQPATTNSRTEDTPSPATPAEKNNKCCIM